MKRRAVLIAVGAVVTTLVFATTAFALVNPSWWYTYYAPGEWTYNAPNTGVYNCMAYARLHESVDLVRLGRTLRDGRGDGHRDASLG